MRLRVESPVGVVRNAPPRECACIPPDAERRELPLLHLNALAAVRLRALYLEVVVLAAMRLDREIDTRGCGYLVAERAQKLLALIGVVWRGLAARELIDALRDELARENGQLACQVECPPRLGMRVLTGDECDSFVEVPERGGEATLSETADPRNESPVRSNARRASACAYSAMTSAIRSSLLRCGGVLRTASRSMRP